MLDKINTLCILAHSYFDMASYFNLLVPHLAFDLRNLYTHQIKRGTPLDAG